MPAGLRNSLPLLASPSTILPLVLLFAALAFGGSGGQPLRDIVLQLIAIVVLAAAFAGWIGDGFSPDARVPLALMAGLVVLLLLQIVPLPASVWSGLGGRDFSVNVLQLIGVEPGARPISIQPENTVRALLALLPGFAMAVAVMRLETPKRMVLAWAAVIAAVLSLVLGVAQASLGSGAAALTLYRTSHTGLPIGFFANTNHQAALLVVGFVLAGSLAPPARKAGQSWLEKPYWLYGLMIALAVGVVATGSRAGLALIVLALIGLVLRERLSGHVRLFLLGGVGLVAVVLLLVLFNPVFARSFGELSDIDDPRFTYWPNVLWAIGHFGWLGTGAGTFDGIYRSSETLDTLTTNYVNHAHNDYLEIALETGVPGVLLLVAFLAFFVWRSIGVIRRTDFRVGRSLAYGAMICVGALLLHSAADYPMRIPLLAVLFGMLCAMMTRSPSAAAQRAPARAPKSVSNPGVVG